MAKITEQPTKTPDASEGLAAEALRAEAWAGEPFLRPDEEVETQPLGLVGGAINV